MDAIINLFFEPSGAISALGIASFSGAAGLAFVLLFRKSKSSKQPPLDSAKEASNPTALKQPQQAPSEKISAETEKSQSSSSITPQVSESEETTSEPTDHEPTPARSEYKTLHDALSKTRDGFWGRIKSRFTGQATLGASEIEELEEILYTSDMGPKAVDQLITSLGDKISGDKSSDFNFVQSSLRDEIEKIFRPFEGEIKNLKHQDNNQPTIWMVVGVNGAGKTTTIGKLASQQVAQGKRVLIAAGDTFRAAADAQLKVWATRAEVEIFSPENIKDPSAVAFDAIKKGVANNFDIIIIDTAGRLHTQKNLMEELKKMKRVMNKALPDSPHETLLVLDANSGQNALIQAEQFNEALGLTGVILTKMDGSAKGGVAVGIAYEHQLPIKMIGVGEKIEDLRPFVPKDFVAAIF